VDHYYKDVPGWAAFTDLYRNVVDAASPDKKSTFVEIGSWLGRSAAFMGVEIKNSGKPITLHCVDPWIDGGPDLRDTHYFRGLRGESPYDIFLRNVHRVMDVIMPCRMTSIDAASRFDNKSIDFLMIDGDHGYEAVRNDLAVWLPKMRVGGIVSGDDYLWPGVKRACEERFGIGGVQTHIHKQAPDYRKSVSYWWKQL